MKKLFTRTTIFLFTVITILLLSSCTNEHTHNFSSDWSWDDQNHWHACTGDNCTETSQVTAHTLSSDIQITIEPSEERDGEGIYSCICGYTKTEVISFTGITEEQYLEITNPENYDNCTITMYAPVIGMENNKLTSLGNTEGVMMWDNNKVHLITSYELTDGGIHSVDDFTELTEETKPIMQNTCLIFNQISYDRLTYDASTKTYTVSGEVPATKTTFPSLMVREMSL